MLWCQTKEVVVVLSLPLGNPIQHTLLTHSSEYRTRRSLVICEAVRGLEDDYALHGPWVMSLYLGSWAPVSPGAMTTGRKSKNGGLGRWFVRFIFWNRRSSRFHVGLGSVFYLGRWNTASIEWRMTACMGSCLWFVSQALVYSESKARLLITFQVTGIILHPDSKRGWSCKICIMFYAFPRRGNSPFEEFVFFQPFWTHSRLLADLDGCIFVETTTDP